LNKPRGILRGLFDLLHFLLNEGIDEHHPYRYRRTAKGKKFEFREPDNFLLGRDNAGSNAHFRLDNNDTQVSRNHFLLEINPPDCFIRDAGSLNGTFIVRPGGKAVDVLSDLTNSEALKTSSH
jgi:pSer/pThr/pTyr-binding forkhead associated (FHA) protein